ncbi:hypothetical protein [Mangrovicoccus sp. HB161399]|uniref:hypothetical protein n=1 Tax=Mangrovicoccus sp. HB161399 TaxID=2720392 RepID=UPI0015545789|nr:hypothetical protein [Mangrovicoccus sp. HB161399]
MSGLTADVPGRGLLRWLDLRPSGGKVTSGFGLDGLGKPTLMDSLARRAASGGMP